MESGRPEKVSHALSLVVRHWLEQIDQRRAVVAQRPKDVLGLLDRTGVDAADSNERFAHERRWPGRVVWKMEQHCTLRACFRRARFEIAPPPQHGGSRRGRMDHNSREHRSGGVSLKLEAGDDAEVAAAASNGPEQIVVFSGAGCDKSTVCQNDLCGQQVVDRKAMLA
jgi:hypothetical protein